MAPKNKKPKVEATVPKPAAFTLDLAREGALEIASNSEKGILAMPVELRTEILDNFLKITLFTETTHDDPVLPEKYLARTDALRALSQVCVAYRREFLPFLWEKLNICCDARDSAVDVSVLFHINIGKALERKCDGLIVSPHLQPYIRTANVVLTRYKAINTIPKFRTLLKSLENLHTLYLLHTHTQLGKYLKQTFEDGVIFPSIRTLAIQSYCHHILRCCPNVTSLWCVRDDGKKLLSTIQKYCKKIEEIRGFGGDEKFIIALAKAVPNLRIFEVWDTDYVSFLKHLPSFKNFNTLIIKTSHTHVNKNIDLEEYTTSQLLQLATARNLTGANERSLAKKCIKDFKIRFESLPPAAERRRIRLMHAFVDKPTRGWDYDQDQHVQFDADRCSGKYLEVNLD